RITPRVSFYGLISVGVPFGTARQISSRGHISAYPVTIPAETRPLCAFFASLRLCAFARNALDFVSQPIHNPRDSVLDQLRIKVDQQTELLACETQIGE